jgi:Flp pilus assembly protein TadD
MADGVRKRERLLARQDDLPATDDFLFHLSRGSELLVQNRVVDAKEELEKALGVRPQDAQGQDLLAGVYFRLGVYPSAIRLWRGLLEEFPDDVVLRVNLGLCLFKTGQPEEARVELERALELDPEHARAWGYLGLTMWRLGDLEAAKNAFSRGGQASMAARMEEEAAAAVEPAPEPPPPKPATVPPPRMDREPRRTPSRPILAISPPPLSTLAEGWTVALPEDTPMAVGAEGELLIRSSGGVHARTSGVRALHGPLITKKISRPFRVRHDGHVESLLGGDADPILRWTGPVAAVVAPPSGVRYHALRLAGSLLYVREELVHAFDDRIGYESGRLPLAGEPALLIAFSGEGTVVLRLARRPSGLEVGDDDEVHVDPAALVGWTGRLFPSEVARPNPPSAPLAFRGQGIVLVT